MACCKVFGVSMNPEYLKFTCVSSVYLPLTLGREISLWYRPGTCLTEQTGRIADNKNLYRRIYADGRGFKNAISRHTRTQPGRPCYMNLEIEEKNHPRIPVQLCPGENHAPNQSSVPPGTKTCGSAQTQ